MEWWSPSSLEFSNLPAALYTVLSGSALYYSATPLQPVLSRSLFMRVFGSSVCGHSTLLCTGSWQPHQPRDSRSPLPAFINFSVQLWEHSLRLHHLGNYISQQPLVLPCYMFQWPKARLWQQSKLILPPHCWGALVPG